MPFSFHEFLRMKETAGDSWQTEPAPPVQIMLGPNAPIAGNLTGQKPPDKEEQFGKPKQPKRNRPIHRPFFDEKDLIGRNKKRARESGINP